MRQKGGWVFLNLSKMMTTIDMHVAGEPLRIITGGLPAIKGGDPAGTADVLCEELRSYPEISDA